HHTDIGDIFTAANGHTTFCGYDDDNVEAIRASYNAGHQLAHHGRLIQKLNASTKLSSEFLVLNPNSIGMHIDPAGMPWLIQPTRPPYGAINDTAATYIQQKFGLTIVLWTEDSKDASGYPDTDWNYNFYSNLAQTGAGRPHMTLSHETVDGSYYALEQGTLNGFTSRQMQLVTTADCLGMAAYETVTGYFGSQFSVSGNAIKTANSFVNCEDIWAGTTLCIPTSDSPTATATGTTTSTSSSSAATQSASTTCASTYTARAGDTCASIGTQFGHTAAAISAVNNFGNGHPSAFHQAGDNCASIAAQFEITAHDVETANTFLNCNNIWAGTPICIVGGSTPTGTSSSVAATPTCASTYTSVAGDTCASIATKVRSTGLLSVSDISNHVYALVWFDCLKHSKRQHISRLQQHLYVFALSLIEITHKIPIGAWTPVCIPPGGVSQCTRTYTAKSGDTCESIAREYGTTSSQIQAWCAYRSPHSELTLTSHYRNTFLTCTNIWAETFSHSIVVPPQLSLVSITLLSYNKYILVIDSTKFYNFNLAAILDAASLPKIMSTYNALNFPDALKIVPSIKKGDHVEGIFATSDRQMEAIEKYGIAASYLLTSYLSNGTHGHGLRGRDEEDSSLYSDVEYDPNWPFDREGGAISFHGVSQELETRSTGNGAYGGGSSMPLTHGVQQQHPEKENHSSSFSLDYPEVVLELGSGMGSVGLVAAEGLAIRYSRADSAIFRHYQNQDLDSSDRDGATTKKDCACAGKTARDSTVILTDLPEVCTLMEENVRMQMEQWKNERLDNIAVDAKYDQQRGSKSMEKTSDSPFPQPIVNLKVRSLAWGNQSHVHSISEELRTQRGFDA
ncbi:15579_t:CDS:10, partial [Acaulospora colombiana]